MPRFNVEVVISRRYIYTAPDSAIEADSMATAREKAIEYAMYSFYAGLTDQPAKMAIELCEEVGD